MNSESDPPREGGFVASLHRLGHNLLQVVTTRLEILSTEVKEERLNLVRLILVALTVLFCLQVGLIFALLFVVLAVGESNRLAAIGIGALVMLLGATGGALWMKHWLKHRPPMFATTLAELRKDRDRVRGRK